MTREQFLQDISNTIKLVRVDLDLTQDRMAELLGISKKTLVQIEKGRNQVGWTVAVAFCALFRDHTLIKTYLDSDPLEMISMLAFEHYECPKQKTMGGKVWWNTIAECGGFRLQQNLLSKHYRILDDKDWRWCSSFDEDFMQKRLLELGSAKSDEGGQS